MGEWAEAEVEGIPPEGEGRTVEEEAEAVGVYRGWWVEGGGRG